MPEKSLLIEKGELNNLGSYNKKQTSMEIIQTKNKNKKPTAYFLYSETRVPANYDVIPFQMDAPYFSLPLNQINCNLDPVTKYSKGVTELCFTIYLLKLVTD